MNPLRGPAAPKPALPSTPPASALQGAHWEVVGPLALAINPAESLDSPSGLSLPPMQTASSEHKNFGQPVVSAASAGEDRPLMPAQAAAQFQVLEYLLRKACAEGQSRPFEI